MPVPTVFDHSATGYSLPHAYWMAQASRLAYADPDRVESTARGWGFDIVRHFVSPHAMPFPIEDTQAFVAASDRMIVVAFRGTESRQIRDWLTDTTTPPVPGPGGKGFVHHGFNQALASVHPQIRDTVHELRANNQSVWITGHSLGGALAMLAGARMYFEEPNHLPDGVYTFGQPRTCERLLAAAHKTPFKNRHHRFVNNNDIVPTVPAEPAFTHVGQLHYFDTAGRLHDTMPLVTHLADRAKGVATAGDPFAAGSDGVRDHAIDRYIACLEKNLAS
ncbi:lipase family protein [Streptomyces sp. NRRL B-1140]|uniref:lipase family protein n=1 Tax=Streptomyces sp. NRRL B-1140 TaxID=1415549 RepID=UPI000B1FE46E|nr:lipase family protein [Streptomyces sp. NRRL B-1140]